MARPKAHLEYGEMGGSGRPYRNRAGQGGRQGPPESNDTFYTKLLCGISFGFVGLDCANTLALSKDRFHTIQFADRLGFNRILIVVDFLWFSVYFQVAWEIGVCLVCENVGRFFSGISDSSIGAKTSKGCHCEVGRARGLWRSMTGVTHLTKRENHGNGLQSKMQCRIRLASRSSAPILNKI